MCIVRVRKVYLSRARAIFILLIGDMSRDSFNMRKFRDSRLVTAISRKLTLITLNYFKRNYIVVKTFAKFWKFYMFRRL